MLSRPPPGVTPQPPVPPNVAAQGLRGQHPGPCPCASLLPRLLAAHRMEVRRLLRGALVSLGRRVEALERAGGAGRRSHKRKRGRAAWQGDAHRAWDAAPACPSAPGGGPEGSDVTRRRGRRHEGEERRVAVCQTGGGATERAPLTLFHFDSRGREGGPSLRAVGVLVGRNGCSSSVRDALEFLRAASGQAPAWPPSPSPSRRQWRFSHFAPQRSAGGWWPGAAPLLRLSAAPGGGAGWNPWRALRDRTAPPSLAMDHCYAQAGQLRSVGTAPCRVTRRRRRTRPIGGKRRLAPPLPPRPADAASSPLSPAAKEKAKRVSQIRIRRSAPREAQLTPMGLPKVKRLKKKEFSVEEIYTNQNYKCPSANRSLETIFEEPQEKDGALLLIGLQRRRRLLLFPDFTQPRKRKRPQGAGFPAAAAPARKRAVRRQPGADRGSDLDAMLLERLSALEDFLARQGLDG